jgi:transcriptional regulator GlxA family with amidase domain
MADLLVARLIRCWVNCSGASTTGWLAAIRDPHIGRVLAAMHRDPGHDWTLESLAGVAGQSRSIFAERFSAILGEGAARYLARLRMQLARELLGQSGMSVAEVATRLGYESEASFARAFKRITNVSPGVVRRTISGRTDMDFGF